MEHFRNQRPREASEMFHIDKSAENPCFDSFLLHALKTTDKVLRYGENNQVDFSYHQMVVQRGNERSTNIYAAFHIEDYSCLLYNLIIESLEL